VRLVDRTKPTTEKYETDKLRSIGKSIGESVVSPEEEKDGYGGKGLQKRKVLSQE